MINKLLKYQEVDGQLREIEKELARSEERKKAVEAKKYLDGVEESVNKLDDKASELLLTYESIVNERAKLEEQKEEFKKALDGIEDETGASYLIKKIDELANKIKGVTNSLKSIMEEFNMVVSRYVSIKKRTKEEQETYKENAQKYNEFKASFQDKKKEIDDQLAVLGKKVEPGLMEKYTKKRENKIFPILYAIEDKNCGYCKMELSLLELNKLKNGEVIECQCGRLLYKGE